MNAAVKKSLSSLGYVLEANYYMALWISLMAAIISVTGDQTLFDSDFNNPLINNLRLMLVYLVLAELAVFVYCFIKQSYKVLIFAGLFLLLMSGALEFYGQVNHLRVGQKFHLFFLYTGLSHIFYGVLSYGSEPSRSEGVSKSD